MEFGKASEILVLTGPPGSGKTTAAAKLAQMEGVPKVHLHSDDFWHFIKHGAIEPWRPEANEQNKAVMTVLASAAQGYAAAGYCVIVDGIIGPWFIEAFSRLNRPLHYVILRPSLETCLQRCAARGGTTLVDPAPITSLYEQFAALGPFENHMLPVEGLSKAEAAERALAAFNSGAFLLSR